jgi:hypothetical protein
MNINISHGHLVDLVHSKSIFEKEESPYKPERFSSLGHRENMAIGPGIKSTMRIARMLLQEFQPIPPNFLL